MMRDNEECMVNTVLNGRYEIEQKIGDGGMATVYRGRDKRLHRPVAIKVLHSHYINDPDFLARFQHEAQAAAILSHPNIVSVYDVGQDGDIHYIVMEYIDGLNLKTLINRDAPMEVAHAVAIAEAIAQGLSAAHRVGLVHRDIKPQNILVTHGGEYVQITDFGIAKSHLSTTLTQTGITFGTADYISPEQAQGKKATPRSDLYALGVTLYEMLIGRLPFTGDSPVAVAMQHVNTLPPAPRKLNPYIPPGLEAILLKALAKDPAQRPADAQEMAHMLRSYRSLAFQPTQPSSLPTRHQNPAGPAYAPARTSHPSTGTSIPLPRAATVQKAPRQQGVGCGGFIVGMIMLAGVIALVLAFSSGMLDPLLAGITQPQPVPGGAYTRSPTQATPTPSPEPTPTATPIPLVVVPDIIAMDEATARQHLEAAGLIPVRGQSRNDERIPQGLVAVQEIPGGMEIEQGHPVTYVLSLGPERVVVTLPDWTWQRFDAARQQAEQMGLRVETIQEPSTQVSEGFVIRQEPAAGMRVEQGYTVRMIVSVGDKVWLPDLRGKSEEDARSQIEATDGVYWSWTDYQGRDKLWNYDQIAPGTVVSTVPGGEQWVPRGTGITLGVREYESALP
jgi:serine/threonine-protein kinase